MTDDPGRGIPRLHVVTDDGILDRADFLPRAHRVLEAGGGAVGFHLRGPRTPGRALFERARELRDPARGAGALLLVNDRLDVALAGGLPGVQLGERSLPVAAARALLGDDAVIGASVHSPEAARQARVPGRDAGGRAEARGEGRDRAGGGRGADFLVVGTIFSTPSHPGREGRGPDLIRAVRAAAPLPAIAIGGIVPARVAAVLEAGAHGVAVIRRVWEAGAPDRAVEELLRALGEAPGPGGGSR